jgi:hypothetical protein
VIRLGFFVLVFSAFASLVHAGHAYSDSWEALKSQLKVKPSKIPPKEITLEGWVIPNEFLEGEISEFLLARYPSGCIHVPLPAPENVIYVVMEPGSTRLKSVAQTRKIRVQGTLKKGGRVDSQYELRARSAVEIPL